MRYRYLLIALITLFCQQAIAAVFVVISNADSGPGTLREALTLAAANGSSEKDFINFNLPDVSEAGRTITLFTQLPDVSSRIVIDGTTQPGVKFGVSDAKVIIQSAGTTNFSCLVIDNGTFGKTIFDIEIYGLYIHNFVKQPVNINFDYGAVGIKILRECKNLTVGAAGKGNVICGMHNGITSAPDYYHGLKEGSITGITIQSNIIGLLDDGKTPNSNFVGISLITKGGDVLVGGDAPVLGNIIAANGVELLINQYPDPQAPFTTGNKAVVENNRLGTGITGTETYVDHFVGEDPRAGVNYPFVGLLSDFKEGFITIKNNIISGHTDYNLIVRSSGYVIKGNKIGTDITTTLDLGNGRNVSLEENATGIVGGDDEADKNFIAFGKHGAIYGQSMVINKNSFYCNQDFSINQNDKTFAPAPVIKSVTNLAVTGTAKPGALIQLYYTADCTLCEGKNFIAKVNTNTDGSWVYHGSITRSIIATATIDNRATSEFSVPYLNVAVDESQQEIKAATCTNAADGYIKNIVIENIGSNSGPYTYTWRNESGETVGNALNLVNVPKGSYTLEIKGASCGSAFTNPIPVGSTEIVMDLTAVQKSTAGCNKANGSIKGITAPQATKFEWRDAGNNLVGTKADLDGVPAGTYSLTASNESGCSAQSPNYTIEKSPRTTFGTTKTIKNATCGENNGSITIIFQQQPAQTPESFRWINHATGANVAITTGPELKGLDAGTYDTYITEYGGCEYPMASYTVLRDQGISVITDNVQVEDDHCQNGTGSIKGISANGATPLTFVWTDDNNKAVGNTPNLENVKAGTYHIQITDGSGCTQGLVYTIYDTPAAVTSPAVTDLDLCTAGNALLIVNDAAGGYSYRLYDNVDSTTPLDEQQNGRFAINVTGDRNYYVSKFTGSCESSRAEVKVKVGISALNIANSFTPNGDGHNDYWKISNIESYPAAVVQIFNRNGQKLFESKGYSTPFNGTYNGKPLPVGTYYYIINLNKNCNLLSGSLTILR